MVSQAGFEPATSPLGGARAIQLCHWDMRVLYIRKLIKRNGCMALPCLCDGLITNVVRMSLSLESQGGFRPISNNVVVGPWVGLPHVCVIFDQIEFVTI